MKRTFLLFSLYLGSNLTAQEIIFEKYFPLKAGTVQQYFVSDVSGNEIFPDKIEKKICRSATIKGKTIYYFIDELKLKEGDNAIIGSEAFANGVFYFNKGQFMYSPISWKEELKKANPGFFKVLFPKAIAIDSVYTIKDGDEVRKYKFTGFQSTDVRGKVKDSCLTLIIEQHWPTAKYTDTVWFKKNTGVVKWLRSTGRLEELKQ